jgi:hypothetical protein
VYQIRAIQLAATGTNRVPSADRNEKRDEDVGFSMGLKATTYAMRTFYGVEEKKWEEMQVDFILAVDWAVPAP